MEFYGLHFSVSREMGSFPIPEYSNIGLSAQLMTQLRRMEFAYRQQDALAAWRQNLFMQEILLTVIEADREKSSPANIRRINAVLEHIHSHLFCDMSIRELAQGAKLGTTAFMELFRKVTGTTPKQYILSLRFEYGRDLLLDTELSVSEIAKRCGYEDPLYFSRCFRRHFGLSPGQYRSAKITAGGSIRRNSDFPFPGGANTGQQPANSHRELSPIPHMPSPAKLNTDGDITAAGDPVP